MLFLKIGLKYFTKILKNKLDGGVSMNNKSILFFIFIILAISNFLQTCSTFCLIGSEDIIFGRNYAWMVKEGLIIINKSDMEKTVRGWVQ